MKMRCKHFFCNCFEAFLVSLLDACDRSKTFDKTTVLMLNSVCCILAYLVHERYGLHRSSCLEENHWKTASVVGVNSLSVLLTTLSVQLY
jgi:hypothetical protein